jgi:hypothetical protein
MSRIEELEAELERLTIDQKLTIKIGNKNNVVVGGKALGQRFPVTLYAPSWLKVLDQADEIRQFIEDNRSKLTWER